MDPILTIDFDFVSCIATNIYFKLFAFTILGLTLTFIDEITALHNKYFVIIILFIILAMIFSQEHDFGTIVLLIALLALTFNMYQMRKKQVAK